jgi:hypothetical protein
MLFCNNVNSLLIFCKLTVKLVIFCIDIVSSFILELVIGNNAFKVLI